MSVRTVQPSHVVGASRSETAPLHFGPGPFACVPVQIQKVELHGIPFSLPPSYPLVRKATARSRACMRCPGSPNRLETHLWHVVSAVEPRFPTSDAGLECSVPVTLSYLHMRGPGAGVLPALAMGKAAD